VNLSTDKIIDPLSRLAESMHRHGAKIMIQATHGSPFQLLRRALAAPGQPVRHSRAGAPR